LRRVPVNINARKRLYGFPIGFRIVRSGITMANSPACA
jgi:hypothetical protein